ncbi:DUF3604 domain-containing protein [Halieaceae bacterium IMCC14734]|uniref:DUF3604 domain-containing protein n=1 Tax=Candidatus Litorirhabdus singularis TaxID=2518993 RepID=A0ABT3TC05_9GAMM|nr:DUF3604 domain-containing protein [Candidatus Litorirhabdus singularis]
MFGDLHVHTSYSFDSYLSSQRRDPWDAYDYARGGTIVLPDANGEQSVSARIGRPLDFAAVTDHAEFFGQVNVCTLDSSKLGYWWPHCAMTRANNIWLQLLAANWWTHLGGQLEALPAESFACTLSDCAEADTETWDKVQQAAEEHYDRSANCEFTTFVAYEYTEAFDQNNMHRNVIFRNDKVAEQPVTVYDTGLESFPSLWRQLRERCTELDNGCDVMAIPHNPNLAGGMMFRDPQTPTELTDRLFFEPVVELVQHKGASECRYDRLRGMGLGTVDEQCDFEQIAADNLNMLGSVHGEVRTDRAASVELESFARRNMVRNVLKDGLALADTLGTNPFVMGFIGSTDTHSAAPGSAEEDNYVGHLGRRDSEYNNVQDHFFANPGGHAVVWAQENSRDSIFDALRRKETYATSGTRPVLRFFAGDYAPDLCEQTDMIDTAYDQGVPMGGEVTLSATGSAPRFLVSARKDAGTLTSTGTDLQRVQIIKGWVDADGVTHERVYDIDGVADNGSGVDSNTCARVGSGIQQSCQVWQDPTFESTESAFYYVRLLENPSCRWSTLQCQAAGVNPFANSCETQAAEATLLAQENGASGDVYGKCCIDPAQQAFYAPVIQERAWSSPIWYRAPE